LIPAANVPEELIEQVIEELEKKNILMSLNLGSSCSSRKISQYDSTRITKNGKSKKKKFKITLFCLNRI
jgi:hypothetical protein